MQIASKQMMVSSITCVKCYAGETQRKVHSMFSSSPGPSLAPTASAASTSSSLSSAHSSPSSRDHVAPQMTPEMLTRFMDLMSRPKRKGEQNLDMNDVKEVCAIHAFVLLCFE
jgi:hypothetical protein